jgi:hypothetical protein
VLILHAGGYEQLMAHTPALNEDMIDEILVYGPDPTLPTTTWWWLLTAGPHTSTPLSLQHDLGTAVGMLGLLLLFTRVSKP